MENVATQPVPFDCLHRMTFHQFAKAGYFSQIANLRILQKSRDCTHLPK